MRKILKNKKAVELNISTIIILVLAILVLVILALYFTGGMKSIWDQIISKEIAWDTTKIEDSQRTCAFYCTGNDKNFFCNHQFEIGKDKDGKAILKTCVDTEKIQAYNLQECKDAGFTKDSCPENV